MTTGQIDRSGVVGASIATDRSDGLSAGTAVKGPCKTATTVNISLSGIQTIDGVLLVVPDRVLVKNQTDGTQNGIYRVSSGVWQRTGDFRNNGDVREGTRVWVTDGTVGGPAEYVVTTADPISIGTTSLTFALVEALVGGSLNSAANLLDVADPLEAHDNLSSNGTTIVSASPLGLDSADGDWIDVSGNTGFSAVTLGEGKTRNVRFTGAPTMTVGASLIANNGGSNVVLAAGDMVTFRGYAGGVVRAWVERLSGLPISTLPIANGGSGATTAAAARSNLASVGVVRVQVLTSSGTYTPHANMLYAYVLGLGAGGGGGGIPNSGASSIAVGGGGGGGAVSEGVFSAATIAASQVATIGAAGGGGAGGANAGTTGGDTSLGGLVLAKGGTGGSTMGGPAAAYSAYGGSGGNAASGTGTIRGNGQSGGIGTGIFSTSGMAMGGTGAGTLYGGGGPGGSPNDRNGAPGLGYGAGGGGGKSVGAEGSSSGGNGAPGILIIIEYCSE